MKQVENFRSKGVEIKQENYVEYVKEASEKAKVNLDRVGNTGENVNKVSQYANDRYFSGRYDESEAEVMTFKKGHGL